MWLLPGVGAVVPVQPSWHGEGLAALVAPVRRFWVWVNMALHMLLKGRPRREILLTETAVVGSSLGGEQLCGARGVDALLDHHQLLPDSRFEVCWVHQGFTERWSGGDGSLDGSVCRCGLSGGSVRGVSTRKPPVLGRSAS